MCGRFAEIGIVKAPCGFFRSRDNLNPSTNRFSVIADRSDPATGIVASAPADERIASVLTGAEFFNGVINPCAPAHSAERAIAPKLRTSVTPSNTTTNGVFVVGHPLQNIGQLNIGDSSGLRDYALMIAADQPVQFFPRALPANAADAARKGLSTPASIRPSAPCGCRVFRICRPVSMASATGRMPKK